ncbi:hypothetical protein [Polyangium jinanense]|uniref:Uncharacterized protein n=1 Tax=Polyangium jinanense TaxID=2829994 RepID=A0A9X4ASC1_9BACT|nr:hypothetical protein [Polyangium jinanense]MDC3956196.1 hypothetical protein [Polyangium jinanense]MDC3982969.1 hypothetical protein [Polyangium jinanense]
MSLRLLRPASFSLPLALLALTACAAAPKSSDAPTTATEFAAEPAPAPAPPPPAATAMAPSEVSSDDLRTPDDAQMALSRWESTFLNVMGVPDEERKSSAAADAPPAPQHKRAPAAPTKPTTPAPEGMSAAGGDESPCHGACRAYASMKRAATRLCDLAGKEDDRCAAAQERIDRASERLKAACPRCESIRD